MTAPAGTEVGLYVDLAAPVTIGDVIETQSGRRYFVSSVRVQARGENVGRQHLRAIVMSSDDPLPTTGTLHPIRWYKRQGKRKR